LAGLPAPVVERATALLESFESRRGERSLETVAPETPEVEVAEAPEEENGAEPVLAEGPKKPKVEPAPDSMAAEKKDSDDAPAEDPESLAFGEEIEKDEPRTVSQLELF
ncbi:hypothetical protein IKZ40_01350, partial [bacterium]|nr:hypothetical protein [bacterium]